MPKNEEADVELARVVARALQQLPLRQAPATLAPRVLRALAHRAALPWWHHGFRRWPQGARACFVLLCVLLNALALMGCARLVADLESAPALRGAWALMGAWSDVVISLMRSIPPLWLYEALAVAAALYAMLFALGAAAYRTLYR